MTIYEVIKRPIVTEKGVSKKDNELYILGGKLCEKMKDYAMAEGSYQKALGLTSNAQKLSSIYSNMADLDFDQNKDEDGIVNYKMALKYEASDAWLYSRLVHHLVAMKHFDEAVEYGEKMMKIADFGVGRDLLAKAYAGQALFIWNGYLKRKTRIVTDPEQDVVAAVCMKALKYKDSESNCLSLLGSFDLNTATVEKKLDKAQKAYDYFSRALKADERPARRAELVKLQDQAKSMITQLQGADGSGRMPSSSSPGKESSGG